MQNAENRELVSHTVWRFWANYKGDSSRTYTLDKGITQFDLKILRDQYVKASPFLTGEQIVNDMVVEAVEKAKQEAESEYKSKYEHLERRLKILEPILEEHDRMLRGEKTQPEIAAAELKRGLDA